MLNVIEHYCGYSCCCHYYNYIVFIYSYYNYGLILYCLNLGHFIADDDISMLYLLLLFLRTK
jgi:hypothetical protein